MALEKGYSDFLLTGCAIVPAMAAAFDQPGFALLSHVVLLFAGILVAGMDADAPYKHPDRYGDGPLQGPARGEPAPVRVVARSDGPTTAHERLGNRQRRAR